MSTCYTRPQDASRALKAWRQHNPNGRGFISGPKLSERGVWGWVVYVYNAFGAGRTL